MGGKGSGRRPDLEKRRLVAALKARGFTFVEIGKRLGISHQGARHLLYAEENNRKRAQRRAEARQAKKGK